MKFTNDALTSHKGHNKDNHYKKIEAFLKTVPHLQTINEEMILMLSKRLFINSDTLALFIHIAANTGWIYDN